MEGGFVETDVDESEVRTRTVSWKSGECGGGAGTDGESDGGGEKVGRKREG